MGRKLIQLWPRLRVFSSVCKKALAKKITTSRWQGLLSPHFSNDEYFRTPKFFIMNRVLHTASVWQRKKVKKLMTFSFSVIFLWFGRPLLVIFQSGELLLIDMGRGKSRSVILDDLKVHALIHFLTFFFFQCSPELPFCFQDCYPLPEVHVWSSFVWTHCVLHLRAYLAALLTNPPECSHGVWSRNGQEGCSGMRYDVITQMVLLKLAQHSHLIFILNSERQLPMFLSLLGVSRLRNWADPRGLRIGSISEVWNFKWWKEHGKLSLCVLSSTFLFGIEHGFFLFFFLETRQWRLFIFISRESKWGTLKSAGNPRCAVPAESHWSASARPGRGPGKCPPPQIPVSQSPF